MKYRLEVNNKSFDNEQLIYDALYQNVSNEDGTILITSSGRPFEEIAENMADGLGIRVQKISDLDYNADFIISFEDDTYEIYTVMELHDED